MGSLRCTSEATAFTFANASLANHYGIVFAAAGENVNHLAQRLVTAEYRIKFAVARLLREVVGEATKSRFAPAYRLTDR